MSAALHKLFLAACVLLAAGASLPLLLGSAGGHVDLLDFVWDGPRIEALEHRIKIIRSVMKDKGRALEELAAGRLTLRQAAQLFGRLNAQLDDGNDDLLGAFQVVSEEEALCRNVLAWMESEAWNRSEWAPVLARLKEEYREEFGHPPGPFPPPAAP